MLHRIKIKNKNALVELLKAGFDFEKIVISENIFKDDKTKEILNLAANKQIKIEKLKAKQIKRKNKSDFRENISGILIANNFWKLKNLINSLLEKNEDPFFIVLNDIKYSQNIGAILRTAFAAGANGIITTGRKEDFLSEEASRVSMGAILRIPIVEMNIFEALKEFQKNGIQTFAVHMKGKKYFQENLKGPAAFVLGAEDAGVSSKIMERVDKKISIPMKEGIDSLNVSVSAGIILYEKLRQEKSFS